MSTLSQISAHPTTERYRAAAEAGDADGVVATLAADVVLHSPITDRLEFHGREEIRELLQSVFATVREIRYFAEVGDARTRTVFDRCTVDGLSMEQATRLELNDAGEVTSITLFFRPLPGLARLTASLGPRVVERKHGPRRALLAKVLMAPLALFTRIGDRLIPFFA
jgi:hypothetical protein